MQLRGQLCWYCGFTRAEHEEHQDPLDPQTAVVPACAECNLKKAAQRIKHGPPGGFNWNLEEFRKVVAWRLHIPGERLLFYGEQVNGSGRHPQAPAPLPLKIPGPSDQERSSAWYRCPDLPLDRGGLDPSGDELY